MAELINPMAQTWLAKLQAPDSPEGAKVALPEMTELLQHTLVDDADGCTYQEYIAAVELINYCDLLWRPQGEKFGDTLRTRFGVDGLLEKMPEAPTATETFDGLTALPLTGQVPGVLLIKGKYAIRVEARPIAQGIEFTIIPFFNQRLTKFTADTLQRLHTELGRLITRQSKRGGDFKFLATLASVRRAIANAMPPPAMRDIIYELRRHPTSVQLQEVVEALDRATQPAAIPLLVLILKDTSIPMAARVAAVRTLGKIDHPDVVDPLEKALPMNDLIRREAIAALAQCARTQRQRGETTCLVNIIRLFEEKTLSFNEEVLPFIAVLSESKEISVVPTLQRALDESLSERIRAIAKPALEQLLK